MRMFLIAVTAFVMLSACNAKGTGQNPEPAKAEPVKAEPVKQAAEPVKTEQPQPKAGNQVVESIQSRLEKMGAVRGPDEPVATVNGTKILERQVSEQVEKEVNNWVKKVGAAANQLPPGSLDNLRARMRNDVVEMLIEKQLIGEKLKEKKIEITDKKVDDELAKIAEQNKLTAEDVTKEIEKSGTTVALFKEGLKMNLALNELLEQEMTEEQKKVGDEEVKKFYDENPQYFNTPEQVRASHILVKTEGLDEAGKAKAKEKIEGLLKQVKEGADFAELAKANSDCPSKEQGGDLNFFGREQMVPEFSEAAFAMKVGDTSNVVETKFGYHIIKVTEKKAAESTAFDEVKGKILENLKNQKKGQFWNNYRQEMKSKATIVRLDQPKEQEKAPAPAAAGTEVKSGEVKAPAPDAAAKETKSTEKKEPASEPAKK